MKRILVFLSFIVLVTACASSNKYMGYTVKSTPFTISGGKVIELPMTSAGPIPAESEIYKVEIAGVMQSPSKTSANLKALFWGFSITQKKKEVVSLIKVERVFPDTEPEVVLVKNKPNFIDGIWSGNTTPVDITQQNVPWLYTSGTSVFIYKITVLSETGTTQTLYQPSQYSEDNKHFLSK